MALTDYLNQLQIDKENLVNALTEKGLEVNADETFTSLVPKISNISGGDVYAPEYISFYNYKGTTLENALKNIDFSNITTASYMFYMASNLESVDISAIDLSKLTDSPQMFGSCSKLHTIKTNTDYFDFTNFTSLQNTFFNVPLADRECLTIKVDTNKLASMTSTFHNCGSGILNKLVMVATNDTYNGTTVIDGSFPFRKGFFETLDFQATDGVKFVFKPASSYTYLCYECSNLKTINLKNVVFELNGLGQAFAKCTSLEEVDLSDTFGNTIKFIYQVFYECSNLKRVTVNQAATSCESLSEMFYGCSSLENIDLHTIVGNGKCSTVGMFNGCTILKTVDLSSLVCTLNVNMNKMFYNCQSLEKIDMRKFNFTKITTTSYYADLLYNVPTTCEIIVMNDSCKTWFNTNFADYTNVKTVAELEG